MLLETYKNIDDITKLKNFSSIFYACKHFGIDENGLSIVEHYHVLTTQTLKENYDFQLTFSKRVESSEISRIKKYCENGHCEFQVVYNILDILEFEVDKSKKTLDYLLEEIAYNSSNDIYYPHSYYLKKYGKAYLYNYKTLRELFDNHSNFRDSYNPLKEKQDKEIKEEISKNLYIKK